MISSFRDFQIYLLIESLSPDEIYKKYYSDIPEEEFNDVYQIDPTASTDKLGAYSQWLLKLYRKLGDSERKDFLRYQNTDKLDQYLSVYNDAKKKNVITGDERDINHFKTQKEFFRFIDDEDLLNTELMSKSDMEKMVKKDAKKVFENDDWVVVVPKTHKAACYYGKGTRWCTASKDNPGHFNDYSRQGDLYIVISKKDPDEKYQFHGPSKQFMDDEDSPILDKDEDEMYQDEIIYASQQNVGSEVTNFLEKQGVFEKIPEEPPEPEYIELDDLENVIKKDLMGRDRNDLNGKKIFWDEAELEEAIENMVDRLNQKVDDRSEENYKYEFEDKEEFNHGKYDRGYYQDVTIWDSSYETESQFLIKLRIKYIDEKGSKTGADRFTATVVDIIDDSQADND